MLRALGRPVRTVLKWQLLATAVTVAAGASFAGVHGAASAALGGLVSIVAGLSAGLVAAAGGRRNSAGEVLLRALTAEGVKLGLIAVLLWVVLATYSKVVVPAFLGSFMLTALIFAMAFFVREY